MKCANCNGTRICQTTGVPCHWCDRTGTITPDRALALSEVLRRRAFDGMVNGNVPSDEIDALVVQANELRDEAVEAEVSGRVIH